MPGRVIVDYGDNQIFQFCRDCQRGGHIKAFLNHFCPQVNLQLLDEALSIQLERKFYYILTHGPVRRIVNREGYLFGEYVQKRCEVIQRLREQKKRKADKRLEELLQETEGLLKPGS